MKCFYHQDRDAVAQCVDCGKFLCKECADAYSPCLCEDCASKRKADNQRQNEQTRLENIKELKDATFGFEKAIIFSLILSIFGSYLITYIMFDVFTFTYSRTGTWWVLYFLFFGNILYHQTKNEYEYFRDAVSSSTYDPNSSLGLDILFSIIGFVFHSVIGYYRTIKIIPDYIRCKKRLAELKNN